MANVLTLNDKILYKRNRFLRVAIVFSGILVLTSMVGIVALVPAFMQAQNVLSDAQLRSVLVNAEKAVSDRDTLNTGSVLLRKQVEALNATLAGSDLDMVHTIIALADAQHEALAITHIRYGLVDGVYTVSVSGIAQTRESLDAFGRALKSNPLTAQADIPVSLLAGSTGIEFSIPIPRANKTQ